MWNECSCLLAWGHCRCECVLGVSSAFVSYPAPISEVLGVRGPWKSHLLISSPQCRPSGEYQGQGEPGLQLQHGGMCVAGPAGGGMAFLFHSGFEDPDPRPFILWVPD